MTKPYLQSLVLLLGVFLCFTTKSYGQNMVGELDEKFHLEKSISERLEQTLKTRLDKKYFDITVEAKLKRKSTVTSGRARQNPGSVSDPEEIQKWYTGELNQISRMKNSNVDSARPFELESLMVTLSLSDQVSAQYNEDLHKWLQQWVQSSFGSKGEAQVITRPSNILTPLEEPHGFWHWSEISRFQNLLGMLFLSLAFVLGKTFQGRIVKASEKMSEPAKTDGAEQIELIRNLKIKIAVVSPAIKNRVSELMMQWCDKESQSYLKVAALLEALSEGGAAVNGATLPSIPSLPTQAHLYLPKALANLQELELSLQVSLYQEIYRDLLAGAEPLEKEPRHIDFEFVSSWSDEELKEVFQILSEPQQVALLTRLPQSLRKRYSQIADQDHLRRILRCSLSQHETSDEELLKELQKLQSKKQTPALSNGDMALKLAKLREVWSVFSPLEEALWMHQVVTLYPEAKEILSRDSTPLALLSDWPPETLRKLCLATKTRELAAAAKCLPFLAASIFQVCGESQRMEIQKEMEQLEEPKLNQVFEKFVATFEQFISVETNHRPQNVRQHLKAVA